MAETHEKPAMPFDELTALDPAQRREGLTPRGRGGAKRAADDQGFSCCCGSVASCPVELREVQTYRATDPAKSRPTVRPILRSPDPVR